MYDSTGDSIVARVDGDVPPTALKKLVEEVSMAPAPDDTSLFIDVYEFEVDRANRMWIYDRPGNRIFITADSSSASRIPHPLSRIP